MKTIDNYDIHPGTMALLPYYDSYANLQTIAVEENGHFLVLLPPKKVIDDSCHYYGSSYKGRLEGVKRVMGISKKAPIAVSAELGIFFFPLESPSNVSCVWLSHSHIEGVKDSDNQQALILFTNGHTVLVSYPRKQIDTKILRTAQFRHLLLRRTMRHQPSYAYEHHNGQAQFVHDRNKQTYEVRE